MLQPSTAEAALTEAGGPVLPPQRMSSLARCRCTACIFLEKTRASSLCYVSRRSVGQRHLFRSSEAIASSVQERLRQCSLRRMSPEVIDKVSGLRCVLNS